MADVLFKVIPLLVDGYEKSTASVAIPVTSLVAAFTMLYTFVHAPTAVRQYCKASAALGLLSLVVFFCWNTLNTRYGRDCFLNSTAPTTTF